MLEPPPVPEPRRPPSPPDAEAAARRPRLAWFSPIPPTRSGIATYTAEILPRLADAYTTDVFVDTPDRHLTVDGASVHDAHDFVWRHGRRAYDVVVYQLGNAACHDYIWPYLTRYPGLVVLHDGQVHHARARALLSRQRVDDYRAEFAFSHPDVAIEAIELGVQGLLGDLTYLWPMLGVPMAAAARVAVHNRRLAERLRAGFPGVEVDVIRMGVDEPPIGGGDDAAVRTALGLAPDDVVFAAYGALTPEKRIPQILRALAALPPAAPAARLLLVGNPMPYYDPRADVEALGLGDRVIFAGYVDDDELPRYLAVADVALCLRWPSAGETSASMLRCLAAGTPVLVTDLVLGDLPTLVTPWAWQLSHPGLPGATTAPPAPVGVAIEPAQELYSLTVAMRRLAHDPRLRRQLGRHARAHWAAHHQLDGMAADYRRALAHAAAAPPPRATLPAHFRDDGTGPARALLEPYGVMPDVLAPRPT